MNIEQDIKDLVVKVSNDIKCKDIELKKMLVNEKCQYIVYNDWGIGTQGIYDLIESTIEEVVK